VIILMALLLAFSPVAVEPASHKTYYPQVREARQWLKAGLHKKYGNHRQWRCLDQLWENESHWRVKAKNPTSGAYGIPQALPGRKMRSAGADWRTSAMTQVKWGRRYIRARYGKPCRALSHQHSRGWY
jgi:membrane-bound lytic murein transglycosylase MltF